MTLALMEDAEQVASVRSPEETGVGPLIALLDRWIAGSLPAERHAWFREQIDIVSSGDVHRLARAFSFAPRRLGKADLALDGEAFRDAQVMRPGFDPTGLSVDQAARIAFLLAGYRDDEDFAETVEHLCRTADIQELIAIYRGFAIFPAAASLRARAGEGIRSAMKPVFEALAHRNPYPRTYFDEASWNQMVLKALFIGSTLAPIQGLDERANSDLAATLVDYAEERWAAGRPISPELWRCVGPFADDRAVAALARVLSAGSARERRAAVLALHRSPHPRAAALLDRSVQDTPGTWEAIALGED